nr:hypothetical protein [Tanacetum cinerariifolium]
MLSGVAVAEDPGSENASSPTEVGSLGSVYRPEWGVTNGSLLDTSEACQDLVDHAAPPEDIHAQFSGLKVSNEHLSQRVAALQEQAYDPEAEAKFVAALESLKDLKFSLMDQLEGLKDAPMDVIMAVLYLESDTGGDAPQYIRDLRPSSSQLTIPVYPEVRDPRNPWACKEEIALADAIAANISRAEKKKNAG